MPDHDDDLSEAARTAADFLDALESDDLYEAATELRDAAERYCRLAVRSVSPGMALSSAIGVVVRGAGIE